MTIEAYRQKVAVPFKYFSGKTPQYVYGNAIQWADIKEVYEFAIVRPPYDRIHYHEHYEYMKVLLENRISTEFVYMQGNAALTYHVAAQVMLHLILTDQYDYAMAGGRTDKQRPVKILVPKSFESIFMAEIELQCINHNTTFLPIYQSFPFVPMTHDVSYMQTAGEDMTWNFAESKFTPDPPTQQDWRFFRYGISNYRHHGKTYAANCRHETNAWDEHPWCAICLVNAGIKICEEIEGDYCYICARMTLGQCKDFIAKVEKWRKHKIDKKLAKLEKRSHKCPSYIRHQIHADHSEFHEYRNKDYNGAWLKKMFAFCRPSYAMPLNYTAIEAVYDENLRDNLDSVVKAQLELFEALYRQKSDSSKPLIWPDLQTIGHRGASTGTRTGSSASAPKQKSAPVVKATVKPKKGQVGYMPPTPTRKSARHRKPIKPVKTPQKPDLVLFSSDEDDETAPGLQGALLSSFEPKGNQPTVQSAKKGTRIKPKNRDLNAAENQYEIIMQGRRPETVDYWNSTMCSVTIPGSDPDLSFTGYEQALQAAADISDSVKQRVVTVSPKLENDYMSRPIVKRERVTFMPTPRFMPKIEEALQAYAEFSDMPEASDTLPCNLYDFAKSGISTKVQLNLCDATGNYPCDIDRLTISQQEIVAQDLQSRTMLKVHEMDDNLLEALCHRFEALDVNRSQEAKAAVPVLPELLICDALRHNLIVKENLMARQQAIITATRRRDLATRWNMDAQASAAIVSRPFAFTDTVEKRADMRRVISEIEKQMTPCKRDSEPKQSRKRRNLEEIFNDPHKRRGDSTATAEEGEKTLRDSTDADVTAQVTADELWDHLAAEAGYKPPSPVKGDDVTIPETQESAEVTDP